MTISIKELEEMVKTLPEGGGRLIHQIVNVMFTLRAIDIDEIDRLLAVHRLAMAQVPDGMKIAFEAMVTDLVLVRAFAEQARVYDKTKEGVESFEAAFGEIKIGP